jgi:hypothetical protein
MRKMYKWNEENVVDIIWREIVNCVKVDEKVYGRDI